MNSPKHALIFQGGWDGHKPAELAALIQSDLEKESFSATVVDSLDILADAEKLASFDLIVPCWTMGSLSKEQSEGLISTIRSGVGLGGVHGGMGDAFRGNIDYEWMVGGHFVGHPHVGDYTVRKTAIQHTITQDLPAEFAYNSEQYYMMIDPAIEVLAETTYDHEGRRTTMPVVWTKVWGAGRVFYSALGHAPAEFVEHPAMRRMVTRGLLWASR